MKRLKIIFSCIFLGAFIGVSFNILNLSISTEYFIRILDWGEETIWFFGLLQGLLEGSVFGFFFAIIFTLLFELITKNKGDYRLALKSLIKILMIVSICWLIGGLLGFSLSWVSPEFYKINFLFVPDEKIEMFKYAFVGGAIWGEIAGGLIGITLSMLDLKDKKSEQLIE